jgi:SecD/SecF fusion protein
LQTILIPSQPYQSGEGRVQFPSEIGYIKIFDTALLNSYLALDFVKNKFPSNLIFMYGKQRQAQGRKTSDYLPMYAIKTLENGTAQLEGDYIESAVADYTEKEMPSIKMKMNAAGTRIWANLTEKNINRPIAIVLDNVVYSIPIVNGVIPNGYSEITGMFTTDETVDFAEILHLGKLPVSVKIVQFTVKK